MPLISQIGACNPDVVPILGTTRPPRLVLTSPLAEAFLAMSLPHIEALDIPYQRLGTLGSTSILEP